MDQQDQRKLMLIKFQPDEVLFQHKQTKIVYRYCNCNEQADSMPHIQHPQLLRGVFFNRGVLYEKEESSLMLEIQQRKRCFKLEYYTEEEICNTFQPLLSCLLHLHRQGFTHGTVLLENIMIVQGQVKLRDWMAATNTKTDEKEADLEGLGRCLLSCTFLTSVSCTATEWQQLLLAKIDYFSKPFTILLLIFIRQLRLFYHHAISLISEEKGEIDPKLIEIYEDFRLAAKRASKSRVQSQKNGDLKAIITFSPAKKPILNHKRIIHHENIENKGQGEGKKIQKVKISEKNSLSVHELMNKKLNEQEKRTKEQSSRRGKEKVPIINLSNFGMENNSKKISFKEHSSPMQRIRAYSKKK